jgi:hypothetical protein
MTPAMDEDCEKVAILAIRLIEQRRQQQATGAIIFDFLLGRGGARVKATANEVFGTASSPVEPCLIDVAVMAACHFEEADGNRLPTVKEIIDWIAGEGGIPILTLRLMAASMGPVVV